MVFIDVMTRELVWVSNPDDNPNPVRFIPIPDADDDTFNDIRNMDMLTDID